MPTITASTHSAPPEPGAKRLSLRRIDPLVLAVLLSVALTAAVLLVKPAAAPAPADTRTPIELSPRTHDSWAVEPVVRPGSANLETGQAPEVGRSTAGSSGAAAQAKAVELSARAHDDWALHAPAARALDISPRAHDNWMFAARAAPSLDVSMRSHDDWPLEPARSATPRQP